ncbi:MAG: hypothetical protein ACHQYQ_06570 [Bacteriovoracales bacterium]
MKILLMLFLSISLYSQDNAPEEKEDKCAQELDQKCAEVDGKYNCITADLNNEKKKFSKECFPKFKADVENGKYSHPCVDEMNKACPNPDDKGCVKSKKASFSPDCQELINDQGIPQAPIPEEMDKVIEACQPETITTCDPYLIDSEIASYEEKKDLAENHLKKYIQCLKGVFRKPEDKKCDEAGKEYKKQLNKELPAKGKEFQEIK